MLKKCKYISAFCLIFLLAQGRTTMPVQAENLPSIDSLWNYAKPAETAEKFQALLPQAKTSADRAYYLELLTQIARTHSLQMQFDEAHALLNQVEQALQPEFKQARVRYLLERGRAFNSANQKVKALPLFQQAWEEALQAGLDFYAIDAAHMLAIAEEPEKQLAWNLKALEQVEKSQDPRAQKWAGSLYNNLGWTYHDKAEYTQALSYFEKGLAWHRAQKSGEPRLIAQWSIARCLRSLNRFEEALQMQRALLLERKNLKLEEDGYISEEIAECLLALNRPSEAIPYFAAAYRHLSSDIWLQKNQAKRLKRLQELGNGQGNPAH
jgi:tetratricopeptide (TPR) repeat protein